MSTSVISIQSQVVHGHVGNSAALLPMQIRGLTVAAVPTTLLSNNPHFETMRGRVLESELVGDLLRGVEERGLVKTSRYIVSGYLGSRANGEALAAFVERARKINPDIVYICDPVMGSSELGVFVPKPVVECLLDQLVPLADLLTPNHFELGLMAGEPVGTWEKLAHAASAVAARRGAKIVVTGCDLVDTPEGVLENIVFDGEKQIRLPTPHLPIVPVGTGDLFTGLLTANLVHGNDLTTATRDAAAVISDILSRTIAAGEPEMQLASVIDALLKTPAIDDHEQFQLSGLLKLAGG